MGIDPRQIRQLQGGSNRIIEGQIHQKGGMRNVTETQTIYRLLLFYHFLSVMCNQIKQNLFMKGIINYGYSTLSWNRPSNRK
jgi:hypothetical protein